MQARAPPLGYILRLFLRAFSFLYLSVSKLQMSLAVSLKYTGEKKSFRSTEPHCGALLSGVQSHVIVLLLFSFSCLHTVFNVF